MTIGKLKIGIVIAVLFCSQYVIKSQNTSEKRPNIIFIVTDDQHRNQFNFLEEGLDKNGKKTNLSPTIDRLAAEGVLFTESYVSTSVCTPSRYSILTGHYASRGNSKDVIKRYQGQTNVSWNVHIEPNTNNIAKILQKNGYYTGGVGKNHVISAKNPFKIPHDADPADPIIKQQLIANQLAQINAYKAAGFEYAASIYKGNLPQQYPKALEAHNMDWIVDGALTFLDQSAKEERPFFLYFATTLSHGPHRLGKKHKGNPLATPVGYLSDTLKVMPSRVSLTQRIKEAGLDQEKTDVLWLDDGIAALIDKLETTEQLENTIIFFINDHGVEHGKGSLYEGGIKTVSFAWGPSHFKKGHISNQLVSNIDLMPTALELANVTIPENYKPDGISMLSLMKGSKKPIHKSLFFEIGATRAILKDGYKYLAFRVPEKIKNRLEKNGLKASHICDKPGGRGSESPAMKFYAKNYFAKDQFYHIKADSLERINLYGDKFMQSNIKALQSDLMEYIQKVPGNFPIRLKKKEKPIKG